MKTIDDFLFSCEAPQRTIIALMHHRLTDIHDLQVQMSYGIPMYRRKTWVCYLNPIKKGGVELAFVKGHLLSNEQGLLQRKKRKYVAGIELYTVESIPERPIDEIVQEALILDDMGGKGIFH